MVEKLNAAAAVMPPDGIFTVTPNDATDLSVLPIRAINVSVSGPVKVTTARGTTATVYVASGGWFPIQATRIWSTGTAAGTIVAGY